MSEDGVAPLDVWVTRDGDEFMRLSPGPRVVRDGAWVINSAVRAARACGGLVQVGAEGAPKARVTTETALAAEVYESLVRYGNTTVRVLVSDEDWGPPWGAPREPGKDGA